MGLCIPKKRLKLAKLGFFSMGVEISNALFNEIRRTETFSDFRSKVNLFVYEYVVHYYIHVYSYISLISKRSFNDLNLTRCAVIAFILFVNIHEIINDIRSNP